MDPKDSPERTLEQIRTCCRALDDKKAENLKVLKVEGLSPITDYMILATGTSQPHLKALRNELEKTFKESRITLTGEDRDADSGWVILDAFDFMIHLFTREQRDFYGMDSLWKDAEEMEAALEPLSA